MKIVIMEPLGITEDALQTLSMLLRADGHEFIAYENRGMAEPQDIIITHDYGLAALVLEKVTAVLSPSGFVYSTANIDELLYQRFLNQKQRQAGHAAKIKKRTPGLEEVPPMPLLC